LVELLAALVISGILAGALFHALRAQAQAARLGSARQEVQQNARAALDVISSELRTVPPSALRTAAADSIRYFAPRAFGLVCDAVTPGATTLRAAFPAQALDGFTPYGKRAWGIALADAGTPLQRPDRWHFAAPVHKLSSAGSCIADLGAESGVAVHGFRADAPIVGSGGTAVARGAQLFVFEEVKYDVGSSAGAKWLRRMVGYGSGASTNQQPMAGPLAPERGLVFEYFDRHGGVLAPLPLSPEQRLAIARVRVTLVTQSTARFGGVPQEGRVSTLVTLRN
jgi:type II secretory pathway pseudopilin PulG